MTALIEARDLPGLTPFALALRQALKTGSGRRITRFTVGDLMVELRATGIRCGR